MRLVAKYHKLDAETQDDFNSALALPLTTEWYDIDASVNVGGVYVDGWTVYAFAAALDATLDFLTRGDWSGSGDGDIWYRPEDA